MRRFPEPVQNLVNAFTRLPGVGPKTALRYAFAMLGFSVADRESVARAIRDLERVARCGRCFMYAESDPCDLCLDSRRDNGRLCVVAESRDIATIEATGAYQGRYFVLGGSLNPIEGLTPDVLNIRQLTSRLELEPAIAEVILAFSPDTHGETTMMYLHKLIKPLGRRATRLARGLPIGADLEYADEITLGDALTGRRDL